MLKLLPRPLLLQVVSLLAAITASSCIHYPRFTFGDLPAMRGCVAILPLEQEAIIDEQKEVLSEYLYLGLNEAGLASTMGPHEVRQLFTDAGVQVPPAFGLIRAKKVGLAMSADAVVFGSIFEYLLKYPKSPNSRDHIMIGADIYVYDVTDNTVAWLYSTRLFSDKERRLVSLANLADDIAATMTSTRNPLVDPRTQCWNGKQIVDNLTKLRGDPLFSSRPLLASQIDQPPRPPRPLSQSPGKRPPAAKSSISVLTGKAKSYYDKLAAQKKVVLKRFFKDRSAEIMASKNKEITALAVALSHFPSTTKFTMTGHVDASGTDAEDVTAASMQLRTLQRQLVSAQAALRGRIDLVSKGGEKPLLPNINNRARSLNRRIEIRKQ